MYPRERPPESISIKHQMYIHFFSNPLLLSGAPCCEKVRLSVPIIVHSGPLLRPMVWGPHSHTPATTQKEGQRLPPPPEHHLDILLAYM
jgi:hypothetical protein